MGLEDVEHDFLVGEGDRVEPGDRLHHHSEVPQVQSATYLQTILSEKIKTFYDYVFFIGFNPTY